MRRAETKKEEEDDTSTRFHEDDPTQHHAAHRPNGRKTAQRRSPADGQDRGWHLAHCPCRFLSTFPTRPPAPATLSRTNERSPHRDVPGRSRHKWPCHS